jgi:DNA-binding CsgD family transcriptional regulator
MGEILERLHLKNRAQAIAYAARSGLAEGNLNR